MVKNQMKPYFETHSNVLKSISGNFNKDVADKVDEFKKNYKPEKPVSETIKAKNQRKQGQLTIRNFWINMLNWRSV
jgi:hypothetical protein